MSSVVISGDTSGSVSLTVPAVAGSNTITMPAVTGTAVISGQNSAITAGTAVASTSGTSIDFTGIPSWVKRITVMFSGVSTNGTSNLLVRLTGSGAVETTGYVSDTATVSASSGTTSSTAGFILCNSITATDVCSGNIVLCLVNSSTNLWSENGMINRNGGGGVVISAGNKAITGTLTAVRITTVNGTDTFDAGTINILYE